MRLLNLFMQSKPKPSSRARSFACLFFPAYSSLQIAGLKNFLYRCGFPSQCFQYCADTQVLHQPQAHHLALTLTQYQVSNDEPGDPKVHARLFRSLILNPSIPIPGPEPNRYGARINTCTTNSTVNARITLGVLRWPRSPLDRSQNHI